MLLKSLKKLRVNDKAPDFSLKGTDNKMYSLESFKDKKLLLVVFMCNHCPYVKPKIKPLTPSPKNSAITKKLQSSGNRMIPASILPIRAQ